MGRIQGGQSCWNTARSFCLKLGSKPPARRQLFSELYQRRPMGFIRESIDWFFKTGLRRKQVGVNEVPETRIGIVDEKLLYT